MRMYNTNNLIQVEGGEKIKQADKGSYLSFVLTDTNRNLVEGINLSLIHISEPTRQVR